MTVGAKRSGEPLRPGWTLEYSLWSQGYPCVAGVDEAGRGALAGPVVAAAVVLPLGSYAFDDSKMLSAAVRETMAAEITQVALAWGIGLAGAAEVDRVNVLRATHLAAQRALVVLGCQLAPGALVTDYLKLDFPGPVLAPPRADATSVQVAAASILAKTTRDRIMRSLDARDPRYAFAAHKGYGAPTHLRALLEHGPSAQHRLSFSPVARARRPLPPT